MNERLQQFLSMENISPSKFAEILGIQRSGISHILSGRNNPSFDFIQRMLANFPNLNAQWLITGRGKPYLDQSSNTTNIMATVDNDLFSQKIPQERPTQLFQPEIEPVSFEEKRKEPAENEEYISKKTEDKPRENQIKSQFKPIEHEFLQEKHISRVIVFYDDGTFEER